MVSKSLSASKSILELLAHSRLLTFLSRIFRFCFLSNPRLSPQVLIGPYFFSLFNFQGPSAQKFRFSAASRLSSLPPFLAVSLERLTIIPHRFRFGQQLFSSFLKKLSPARFRRPARPLSKSSPLGKNHLPRCGDLWYNRSSFSFSPGEYPLRGESVPILPHLHREKQVLFSKVLPLFPLF